MKILAIIGTGKRKGNVSRLCSAILDGAKAAGNECEMINLFDYKINYCIGCRTCSKDGKGKCFQNDDFETIVSKIIVSDVIILGSPIYWGNISAIMKNFLDRHMSVEYLYPKGDEYAKLPFLKKIQVLIDETKKIKIRSGMENKQYIIVTAMTGTTIFKFLNTQYLLFLRCIKQYVNGMHGKVIKKFIYTDTLFKFLKHKDKKIIKQAYHYGRKISAS
jgi:multimeric flavodoxin WrbA